MVLDIRRRPKKVFLPAHGMSTRAALRDLISKDQLSTPQVVQRVWLTPILLQAYPWLFLLTVIHCNAPQRSARD